MEDHQSQNYATLRRGRRRGRGRPFNQAQSKVFATLGTHPTLQVAPNVGATITALKVNTRPRATPNRDLGPFHQWQGKNLRF